MAIEIKINLPIVWEDPPEPKMGRVEGGANEAIPWAHVLNVLMQNQGRWARIEGKKSANNTRLRILNGSLKRAYPQLRSPHRWESIVREGECYVRYLGEELPQ